MRTTLPEGDSAVAAVDDRRRVFISAVIDRRYRKQRGAA